MRCLSSYPVCVVWFVQTVLEVLRAFVKAIPRASPEVRDGFVLAQVMGIGARLAEASQAGDAAIELMCKEIGDGML